VAEHVPDYWGIITVDEVDGQPDFYFLRRPEANKKVKLEKRLELLWRPELGMILESFNLPIYKSQSKPFIRKKLLEFTKQPITKAEETRIRRAAKQNGVEPEIPASKVNPDELKYQVSEVLFERDEQKLLADISEYRKMNNPRRRGLKKSTRVRRIRRRAKKA
jgi:hypothetical protein